MEIIQIYTDSSTVYEEWSDADYFEAGLYSGKGVVNAYFAAEGVYNQYANWSGN